MSPKPFVMAMGMATPSCRTGNWLSATAERLNLPGGQAHFNKSKVVVVVVVVVVISFFYF